MSYLLAIGGHDPVHGAGVTADLATWAAMGWRGASVVTVLTVQNSQGVQRVHAVDARLVAEALAALAQDGEPAAIKIGMLGSIEVVRELMTFVRARRVPVVLDPVLAASNGHAVSGDADFAQALLALAREVTVVTPNALEASLWLAQTGADRSADDWADAQELARQCGHAVVLKGGHRDDADSVDWVVDRERMARLANPRLPAASHGTGCVYASVLAAMLADGWDVFEAAAEAKLRVHAGIAQAVAVGPGRPNTATHAVLSSAHLPSLRWLMPDSPTPEPIREAFAPLVARPGFYPVVDSADWVERLLGWGVRTIQLRIKAGTLPERELRAQIEAAVAAACAWPDAQLFINDHWRAAIEAQAYGVHLGQEDIETADLAALRAAGLRLGVSSHTPAEMARAHAVQPSYVALWPVYPTTLKAMHYDALGLERLRAWTQRYQPRYPVVAIGGISLERAPAVWACGVDGVAVVSAVTQAADPRAAVAAFVRGAC